MTLPNLSFNLGNLTFKPTYLQAGIIIFLLFALVLTMAKVRRHFLEWSFKGTIFGIVLGFILALILEGFLIVGGRTFITTFLGWKGAPKPIETAIDSAHTKLLDVLGTSSSCDD